MDQRVKVRIGNRKVIEMKRGSLETRMGRWEVRVGILVWVARSVTSGKDLENDFAYWMNNPLSEFVDPVKASIRTVDEEALCTHVAPWIANAQSSISSQQVFYNVYRHHKRVTYILLGAYNIVNIQCLLLNLFCIDHSFSGLFSTFSGWS